MALEMVSMAAYKLCEMEEVWACADGTTALGSSSFGTIASASLIGAPLLDAAFPASLPGSAVDGVAGGAATGVAVRCECTRSIHRTTLNQNH
jgi:hypothetical protein